MLYRLCAYLDSIVIAILSRNGKAALGVVKGQSSEWVLGALERRGASTKAGWFSFQGGIRSFRASTAADAVNNRLPRLNEVKEIHSVLLASGKGFQLFETNCVLDMYVKSGSMVDARKLFDNMQQRNVVSWNVMILGYAKKEECALALELYARMKDEGVQPSERTFLGALKACSGLATLEAGIEVGGMFLKRGCLERGRTIHSEIVHGGFDTDVYIKNTLLDMYAKCGSMTDARFVFDSMPHHDVVSWNVMILGYVGKQEGEAALQLYAQMQQEGVAPDDRTFVGALKACCSLAALEEGTDVDGKIVKIQSLAKGRAIHSHLLDSGLDLNKFVGTTLIDMYIKCGSMEDARRVFENFGNPNVVSWNAMILGHAEKEESEAALQLFARMQQEGFTPNDRTFVGALKACSGLAAPGDGKEVDVKSGKIRGLQKGKEIHSQVVNSGFESDMFVGTTLVDMYAKCGSMVDARRVFDKLARRDVVSWTAMILGYAEQGEGGVALQFYAQMQCKGIIPNGWTFVAALKACSSLAALEQGRHVGGKVVKIECLEVGRAIHSQIVKSGFESNLFVASALVDMYSNCGSLMDARNVFDKFPHRDVVLWNALIAGYVDQGESEKAFKLYKLMQNHCVSPNGLTFVSILKACGNSAALEFGKEIHAETCRLGVETSAIVVTTLIDMYGRCGSMADAQQFFDALPTRHLVTWNALIAGYARQGDSDVVFDMLERMRQEGIQPDRVTFLSVLTVCSYAGLVDRGKQYFEAMSTEHGIAQTIEHYSCIVDLLGRAGQVEEAVAMVEKMPLQPDLVVWRSVLGACRKWKKVEIGRHAFDCAVRLDEEHPSAYVLMSNIYADAHMWEKRDDIQSMRKNARAWKMPGQSWWTDSGGIVHTFVVGDTKHPQSPEIYAKLKKLFVEMKLEGYVPHLDSVLWDMSNDQKEDALCGHSEKLAIAHALLSTPPGSTIRIVKNLRVCEDCHTATALISKIEKRNIICRDFSRFHNYKDGKCSCGDYW